MPVFNWNRRRRYRRLMRRPASCRYVHKAIRRNQEKKIHTFNTTSGLVQPGTLYNYTVGTRITKGTDKGDRVGRSVKMTGLVVTGHMKNPNTTAGNKAYVRMFLCANRPPLSTDLTTGLWRSESDENNPIDYQVTGDLSQINKPFARSNRWILWQKRFMLGIKTTDSTIPSTKLFTFKIPLHKRIMYIASSNDVRPQYYLCWFFETETGASLFSSSLTYDITFHEYFYDA